MADKVDRVPNRLLVPTPEELWNTLERAALAAFKKMLVYPSCTAEVDQLREAFKRIEEHRNVVLRPLRAAIPIAEVVEAPKKASRAR